MTSIEKAAQIILTKNMNVKKGEKVLIITDENKKQISELLLNESSKITDTELIEIPVGKMNGEEPEKEIAEKMLDYDVILMPTTKSLSHTIARKNASEKGARIASMPGITEEILERAIDVNHEKIKHKGLKLKEILANADSVNLLTQKGTMLAFSIKGREPHGGKAGICHTPGSWANIPDGEVFIAPVEGTADGVYVIDASVGSIGKTKTPIKIIVEKGYAVKITGEVEAEKLKHVLEKCGKEAFQIAEFGIGTNPGAKITGIVLEDEKAIGTCHIALGSNFAFGGNIKVNCHIDGVIRNPTIIVDNKRIMERGKFLI